MQVERRQETSREQAGGEVKPDMPISPLKVWAAQIRAPFLLLSVLLTAIGGGAAYHHGRFDLLTVILCAIGVTLAHVAVNLFNELSDHATGIDELTLPTPFSGGSKTLQKGLLSRGAVTRAAWGALLIAALVGGYLTYRSGWPLLLFLVAGGLASVFYTSHLSRWMLGELVAGTTLGSFVVLGTYYAQAGQLPWEVILLSLPPGMLTALLLLLNELPDREADAAGGRRHLVIALGPRRAAWLYAILLFATYGFLALSAGLGLFPRAALLALLTLPLAVKATTGALAHGSRPERLVPALAANVGVVLGTDLLLAVSYFL